MALYDYLDLAPLRVQRISADDAATAAPPSASGGFFSPGNGVTINADGSAYDGGGWSATSGTNSAQDIGGLLATAGKVGTVIGVATNNQDLAKAASNIGLAGRAISAPTALDAAQVIGGAAAVRGGISAPVVSTINGAIDGFQRGGTVNDALLGAVRGTAASVPGMVLGAVNPVLGLLGSVALSGPAAAMVDAVNLGSQVSPESPMFSPMSNTVSQHQMGKAIMSDEDPIGALINALSPAQDKDENETETGVNVTTPGVVSSPVTSGIAIGTPLGQLSTTTTSSFTSFDDFGSGGWSDPTSGVDGSTAATADSPDGPDGMNAGQGFDLSVGGDSGGGGWDGGYGGVDSGGYDGPGAGGWY